MAIDASQKTFMFYHSGVYSDSGCSSNPEKLDHAVLVVGYGTDASNGKDYWLIKNSWATSWGDQGYMKISRKQECLPRYAAYPTVDCKIFQSFLEINILHN